MKAVKCMKMCLAAIVMLGFASCGQNEPETPTLTPIITESQVKSYFPYGNGDRIVFFNDLIGDITYTVSEATFNTNASNMEANVTMFGTNYLGEQLYFITLKAEVANKRILKIEFSQGIEEPQLTNATSKTGSYVYEASESSELSQSITLSDGSIIKQEEGLVYFVDFDAEKWYFKKRL